MTSTATPSMQHPSLAEARSILIVRLDALGDVVLMSPFLRELRRNAPKARITLIVRPPELNLVELCPHVDHIITFQGKLGNPSRARLAWRYFVFCASHIWMRRWDVAINPRFDVDYYGATRLLSLTRAARRIGYSASVTPNKKRLNPRHDRWLTDPLYACSARHEVLHNIDVIRQLGGSSGDDRLELWLSVEDDRVAQKLTERFGGDSERLCAIVPAAAEARKVWPAEYYAQVVRFMCKQLNCNVVVVGGRDARDFGSRMEAELPSQVLSTAGRLTIRQSAALLKRCKLTLSNDSGPMHLAAAAGSQVVAISCHPVTGEGGHDKSPIRFGPWGSSHKVLQPLSATPPCTTFCGEDSSHCIRGVSPEQVLDTVSQLLSGEPRVAAPDRGRYDVSAHASPGVVR